MHPKETFVHLSESKHEKHWSTLHVYPHKIIQTPVYFQFR